MRIERRSGYRVVVGGPVPPQADAITLGKTIIVRKSCENQQVLMAHELVHVRQFGDLGSVRFLLRYVGSYVRFRLSGYGHMASYRRIPLEVEASWLSRLHHVAELEPCAPKTSRDGLSHNATTAAPAAMESPTPAAARVLSTARRHGRRSNRSPVSG